MLFCAILGIQSMKKKMMGRKGCTGAEDRGHGICKTQGADNFGSMGTSCHLYCNGDTAWSQLSPIRPLYSLDCLPSKISFPKGCPALSLSFACSPEQLNEIHVKSQRNYLDFPALCKPLQSFLLSFQGIQAARLKQKSLQLADVALTLQTETNAYLSDIKIKEEGHQQEKHQL